MDEKSNKEIEELRDWIERLQTEKSKQREKNMRLREDYEALMDKYESLEEDNLGQRKEKANLTEKHGSLEIENEKLKNETQGLKHENLSLTEENKNLHKANTEWEEMYQKLQKKNTEWEELYETLSERSKSLEDENKEQKFSKKKLENENEVLKDENKKLADRHSDLKEVFVKLQEEHMFLTRKYESLRAEDRDLQKENSSLTEKYANLRAKYDELNKLNDMKENNVYAALHQELNDLAETAYDIHNRCCIEIEKFYKEEKKEITLPIDIQKVAEHFKINIEYDNLNFADQKRIDQNIAQLYYEVSDGSVKKKIIVDNSITEKKSGPLSNLEKYAVAYELGKVIVGNEQEIKLEEVRNLNMESTPYSLPRLSASLKNFEYEMCAIFLLLPIKLFFKEFKNFLNEIQDHPVMVEKWIGHLSEKAEIPSYQLINGYQYIKFSAYRYFEMNYLGKAADKLNGSDESDYRELYNV